MSTAEQVYLEIKTWPKDLVNEVMDFVGYLKTRYEDRLQVGLAPEEAEVARRRAFIEESLAPYRLSIEGYRFDREEANER